MLPIIALTALFFANSSIEKVGQENKVLPAALPAPVASRDNSNRAAGQVKKLLENYSPESMAPRFPDLPFTAPRYDNITVATTAPVPAACVSNKKRCQCYSQQATPINVSDVVCRDFVAHGYFQDFQPQQQSQLASNNQNKSELPPVKNREVLIPTPSQINPFPINAGKIKS